MTQTYPTTALFLAKGHNSIGGKKNKDLPMKWCLGDPLRVIIRGTKHPEKFPLCGLPDRKARPVKLARSKVGLFEEPYLSGRRYWILISTLLDDSTHDEWVSFYESEDAHSITWVGHCSPNITFFKKAPFRYNVLFGKKLIRSLVSATDKGMEPWMEHRMSPRRHSASVRTMPGKVIQAWINL